MCDEVAKIQSQFVFVMTKNLHFYKVSVLYMLATYLRSQRLNKEHGT